MNKKDLDYVNSVARLKNRVAVKRYYLEELPKDLRSLSFTVSNLETLRQIQIVQRSLDNAIEEGLSFESWKDNLDTDVIKRLSNARLETVYRTNTHNVYNQSTRYNAMTSDVTPYLMYTAVGDERTRPEHMKLDGTIKRADSIFWDRYTPPLGYNCTAFKQKVSGDFTKAFRSPYKGDMISIKLKSGKTILGITPNHPVMTDKGFVFAKNINSSDNLVCDNIEIKGLNLSVQKKNYDLVATSGERFKSMFLHRLGFEKSTSFDFHNDIEFMDKNIDVVTSDSFLSGYGERAKRGSNFIFKLSDYARELFGLTIFRKSSTVQNQTLVSQDDFNVTSTDSKFDGNISSALKFKLIEVFSPLLHVFNIFSEKFLSRTISSFNSKTVEPSINRISTDPELVTKFQNANPFIVEVDQVLSVKKYFYFGFVYDFESIHGLVIADGIVTGNCRCGTIPMSKEDANDMGISKRNLDSFPEPEFGDKKMGDVLSGVSDEAVRALDKMPSSSLKIKFKESQELIKTDVDLWYEKNKTIFKQE